MAKFNEVQKKKRALKAERKRAIHGDPSSRKLKIKSQTVSVSGKRKRKLLKKWRRDQKDSLLNIHDVQMTAADANEDESQLDGHKTPTKFPIKKTLKLKQLKRRGKGKGKSAKPTTAQVPADAMVE